MFYVGENRVAKHKIPYKLVYYEAFIDRIDAKQREARNLAKHSKLGDFLEILIKKFQLYFINRQKTTEIITDSQLWFHSEDFGKKVGWEAFSHKST